MKFFKFVGWEKKGSIDEIFWFIRQKTVYVGFFKFSKKQPNRLFGSLD